MDGDWREDSSRAARRVPRRAVAVAAEGGERVLAAVAHGAILLGFGYLSILITVIIWLVSRRSPYVKAQSDRAGRYQLFVLLINIIAPALWLLGLALFLYLGGWRGWGQGGWRAAVLTVDGLVLLIAVPVFVVWYFGTIAYGLYAALRALAGADFHYPPPPWRRPRGPLDRALRWER